MKNKFWMAISLCASVTAAMTAGCVSVGAEEETVAVETELTVTESAVGENGEVDAATEYPIVIEHAYGETVIEREPENIVTLGWCNQDTPLALGVAPVGVSAANYGKVTEHTLHLWTEEAFVALGVEEPNVFDDIDGYDYEAVSDANPDVIIAAYSGMTEEEYNLLSEIAPTVPFATAAWQTTWRDQTIINATAMGRKAEGEALVKDTEKLISEKLSEYPELAGTRTAFFWITPDDFSTFYVYLPTDPRAAFLEDLGLELPESVAALAESASDFSVTLSRETADQLNDVEMMIVYGDEALLESLQADPLMSQIPAIANGAVVLLDSESVLAAATTPSILSIPYTIDEYLSVLSEARGNVK